jgi:hypothetical protein
VLSTGDLAEARAHRRIEGKEAAPDHWTAEGGVIGVQDAEDEGVLQRTVTKEVNAQS